MAPRIGDVIEIPIVDQYAYAHYSHEHKTYGALLRVMPATFAARPSDFEWISGAEPQFLCFFPLVAAIKQGLVERAGRAHLAEAAQAFPVFRASVRAADGWGPWWLWDGEKEWRIGALQTGMEQLPIRGVINDTLLVERIRSGWRAERDA